MADDKQQVDQLSEPFPQEQLRYHKAKGLTYVAVAEVLARLNRILGPGNWNTEILGTETFGVHETETGIYPEWVVAKVRLYGEVDGQTFSFDGIGGQQVKFLSSKKGPVDIGDEFKGAVSDAIKKAAQSLGVALNLAREDDAMHYEKAQEQADEPKATKATLDLIQGFVKGLAKEDEKRKGFAAWWAENTGGAPGKKFDSGQVTVKEADEAIRWLGIDMSKAKENGTAKETSPEGVDQETGEMAF